MDIGINGRALLLDIVVILVIIGILSPILIHYYAKHWLKRFFKVRIEKPGCTPRMVRAELTKLELRNQYWQVKWLCRWSEGEFTQYDLRNFLKSFSGRHFGTSSSYE